MPFLTENALAEVVVPAGEDLYQLLYVVRVQGTAIWKAGTTGAGPGRRLLAPSTPMLTPLSHRSRVRPKRRSLDSPAEPEEHAGEQGGRGRTARSPPDPWKRERYRLDETARGSSTDKKVLDGMKVISGGCWKQGIYPSKTG